MLDSMQSGTLSTMNDRDSFHPTTVSLDANASQFTASGMNDHWGYHTNNITGGSTGESSFDLNDDNGRDNTTFSAGHDGGASGTDFAQYGGANVNNATGRYLALYWK